MLAGLARATARVAETTATDRAVVRGENALSKSRAPHSRRVKQEQARNQEIIRQYGRPGVSFSKKEFQGSGYAIPKLASLAVLGTMDPIGDAKGFIRRQRERTKKGLPPKPMDVMQVAAPWEGGLRGRRFMHGTRATFDKPDPAMQNMGALWGPGHYMSEWHLRPGSFVDTNVNPRLKPQNRRVFASFTNANDFAEQLNARGASAGVYHYGASDVKMNRRMKRALVEAGRPTTMMRSGAERPHTDVHPIQVTWTEPDNDQFQLLSVPEGTRLLDADAPLLDDEAVRAADIMERMPGLLKRAGYQKTDFMARDPEDELPGPTGADLAQEISAWARTSHVLDREGRLVSPQWLFRTVMKKLGYEGAAAQYPRNAQYTPGMEPFRAPGADSYTHPISNLASQASTRYFEHDRLFAEAEPEMGRMSNLGRRGSPVGRGWAQAIDREHREAGKDLEVALYNPNLVRPWFGDNFQENMLGMIERTGPEMMKGPWVSQIKPDPNMLVQTQNGRYFFRTRQGRIVETSEKNARDIADLARRATERFQKEAGRDPTQEEFYEILDMYRQGMAEEGSINSRRQQRWAFEENPNLPRSTRAPENQGELEEFLRSFGRNEELSAQSGVRLPRDSMTHLGISRDGVPIENFQRPPRIEDYLDPGVLAYGTSDLTSREEKEQLLAILQNMLNQLWMERRKKAVNWDQTVKGAAKHSGAEFPRARPTGEGIGDYTYGTLGAGLTAWVRRLRRSQEG